MKKVMLIGKSGAGKSTLMQRLLAVPLEYKKTQAVEFVSGIVDTPGEYLERKQLFRALAVTACDVDEIFLILDSTDAHSSFMPHMQGILNKPLTGVITKIDHERSVLQASLKLMAYSGIESVFCVSAVTGEGIQSLKEHLGM